MSLREELLSDLAEAFDEDLADAVTTFTGTAYRNCSYDPIEMGETCDELPITGRGVMTDYTLWEINTLGIPASATKLICLANEISLVPEHGDYIESLRVQNVERDPVGATYIIQLGG